MYGSYTRLSEKYNIIAYHFPSKKVVYHKNFSASNFNGTTIPTLTDLMGAQLGQKILSQVPSDWKLEVLQENVQSPGI